jgi:hypothetical protein
MAENETGDGVAPKRGARAVSFRTATDPLIGGRAKDVAQALGVAPQTILQYRRPPGTAGARRPPDGWQKVVARLARLRGERLLRLAERLERSAAEEV